MRDDRTLVIPPPRLRIHVAGTADLPVATDLLRAQLGEHDIDVANLAAAVAGLVEHPERGAVLLAVYGEEPVGVAALAYTWTLEHGGQVAWLDELYVAPAHRNRGLGMALLDRAIAHARAAGCVAMDLEVDASHARAARLYASAGFTALSRSRWSIRIDGNAET
jgi:GNAT superfamily N-acetyltransferase